MKIIVTLPTYNEAENIKEIILHILKQDANIYVLVIDDKSPDGTGEIVDTIAQRNNRVSIIHREGPRGRGIAGIEGFLQALKMGGDLIIEMDADFSHNPDYIPELIKYAREYDLVIGSRFIKGGKEIGRSAFRRWASILANAYIRILLHFPVKDCSSGYRCFRKSLLEQIRFEEITSRGPSIVSELLFHALVYHGATIKEIPILFEDRAKGISKLNYKILLHNLAFILHLSLKKVLYKIKTWRN